MPHLAAASHADTRLSILRIVRRGDRHDPHDLTLSIRFEGHFTEAFVGGRTDRIVPPETIKSFVREAVRNQEHAEIEPLGLSLCERLLAAAPHLTHIRVELVEQPWNRLAVGGRAQGQAFAHGGAEQRTAVVTTNGLQTSVVSGIQQLGLMRSAGFLTGHPPRRADDGTEDAIAVLVSGTLAARWSYSTSDVAFGPARRGVRDAIVETFAMHAARSVQFTLYAIADVVLGAYPEILDVTVAFEERRYGPADPFGAAGGPEDLFVPADGTTRTVEVTVARDLT